jgi:hypothetical protein
MSIRGFGFVSFWEAVRISAEYCSLAKGMQWIRRLGSEVYNSPNLGRSPGFQPAEGPPGWRRYARTRTAPATLLSGCKFDGTIAVLELLGAGLNSLYENMARMFMRSRQFLAGCIILLLVGVVVLSAATRRPCVQERSRPWHTIKAGRLAAPEVQRAWTSPPRAAARLRTLLPTPSPLTVLGYVPRVETLFPRPSLVDPIDRFRSPPNAA